MSDYEDALETLAQKIVNGEVSYEAVEEDLGRHVDRAEPEETMWVVVDRSHPEGRDFGDNYGTEWSNGQIIVEESIPGARCESCGNRKLSWVPKDSEGVVPVCESCQNRHHNVKVAVVNPATAMKNVVEIAVEHGMTYDILNENQIMVDTKNYGDIAGDLELHADDNAAWYEWRGDEFTEIWMTF